MGLGLQSAFGNDALFDLLARRRAERLQREQFGETQRRNRADEDLRRMQIESTAEIRRQADLDRRQRDRELADVRMENATTRQLGLMPRGAIVSAPDHDKFSKFGFGALFTPSPGQPALPDDFQGPLPDGQTREAMPGGFRFRGTARQDEADERFETQRQIADARMQAQQQTQQALDAYRQANLSLRERNLDRLEGDRVPMDNPSLPHGVSDYLVKLRSKYGNDLQAAADEFHRALPEIRAAHPRIDSTKAMNALRQMFGTAPGASSMPTLPASIFTNPGGVQPGTGRIVTSGPSGRAAGPGVAPAGVGAGGGQSMTRSELRAVAQRMGISEAQAEQQAASRGIVVR